MAQLKDNDTEQLGYTLKCRNSCRNHGLTLMLDPDCNLYNIAQTIMQSEGGHYGVTPHIHLIFPFLPKELFGNVSNIINHCMENIEPFTVHFNDFCRSHGSGKQYAYFVCDDVSKNKLIKLQKVIMDKLCMALRNGMSQNDDAKNTKKNKKKKKKKEVENEVDDRKCCLEEIRNIEFEPHLTLGQWEEKSFKAIRNMVIEAFKENENETNDESKQSENCNEQSLFRKSLYFKVDNLYIVNVKRGKHRVVKTFPFIKASKT